MLLAGGRSNEICVRPGGGGGTVLASRLGVARERGGMLRLPPGPIEWSHRSSGLGGHVFSSTSGSTSLSSSIPARTSWDGGGGVSLWGDTDGSLGDFGVDAARGKLRLLNERLGVAELRDGVTCDTGRSLVDARRGVLRLVEREMFDVLGRRTLTSIPRASTDGVVGPWSSSDGGAAVRPHVAK